MAELRIGDRDRESAVAALGEHFAQGRLTKDEYDERSDAAWTARTAADLRPLFADLPATRPVQAASPARVVEPPRRQVPWKLLLVARRDSALAGLAERYPGQLSLISADLTSLGDRQRASIVRARSDARAHPGRHGRLARRRIPAAG